MAVADQDRHTTTNIPSSDVIFMKQSPYVDAPSASIRELKHLTRSPMIHASKVRTPVLQIAGGRDDCVPVSQGIEFHNALLENGKESVLIIYPQEGHGIRTFPAVIDYCARAAIWFETYIPVLKEKNYAIR
jgi:dipeptidyl aminopeptidase/acylaminoacyl peptidase